MAEQGGRDSDGAGTEGIVEETSREQDSGTRELSRLGMEGQDTDGAGSGGILDDKEQEQAGLGAEASAFGTGDGSDTDGAGSGGMVQPSRFNENDR